MIERNIDKIKKQVKNIQTQDEFTIKLLENLKSWFVDDVEYTGKVIKYRIDEVIIRMK